MENAKYKLKKSIKDLQEKKTFLLVCCISIIVLTFFFFKLTFEKKNETVVEKYKQSIKTNPHIKRELEPLQTCKEIKNPDFDYTLADLYISSSFNTPLIGNQKKDYLSLEFFEQVIHSGARYIEFQINPSSNNDFPEPLVGTGELNNNWGLSLNFLKLTELFKVIRMKAFNANMNYPLILYLDFNSHHSHLIKRVGELIKAYLDDYVVKSRDYLKVPFTFERICKFTNKIIILSSLSDNFEDETIFKEYNMPTLGFVKRIYFDDIKKHIYKTYKNKGDDGDDGLGNDQFDGIDNSLSVKVLEEEEEKFKHNFESKEDILNVVKPGYSFYDKLIDLKFRNPLLYFNKVGLTIIIPHRKEDIFTLNYEPKLYYDNGCQIVAMNFQESLDKSLMDKINPTSELTSKDPIIIRYLSTFRTNSFKLKLDYFRFSPKEAKAIPLDRIFNQNTKEKTNIGTPISLSNMNNVYVIQTYRNSYYYLDTNMGNLRFVYRDFPENTNLFIFGRSRNNLAAAKDGISIIAVNGITPFQANNRKYVTKNEDNFMLRNVSNESDTLLDLSSYYAVNPTCEEQVGDGAMKTVSFRTINDYDPPFLGFNNKLLHTFFDSNSSDMKSKCCFNIIKKDVRIYLYIQHTISKLYLTVLKSGAIKYKNKTPKDTSKFEIIDTPNNDINKEFSLKYGTNKNENFITFNKHKLELKLTNINNQKSVFKIVPQNDNELISLFNNANGEFDKQLVNTDNYPLFINIKNTKKQTTNYSIDDKLHSCYIKYEII